MTATATSPYPGLAYAETLANMEGNADLLRRLALLFLEQHAADVRLIDAALAAGDVERALHLTHALRGTAGNLGARRLHDESRALEQVLGLREAVPAAAPAALRIAMDELVPSLRRLVG